MIWARSALLRPRVIQLFYETTTKTWQARKDSCGGLPPIMNVSREARNEALKGYTRAFDTWVDFEEDTIFICDPAFTIRKPLRDFLNTDHANRLRRVAFTSDVYTGLEYSNRRFPMLCSHPMAVLRKLEGLTHFTLVISEDGEQGIWEDGITDGSSDMYDAIEGPDEDVDGIIRNEIEGLLADDSAADMDEARRLLPDLISLEKDALENMEKFVQHAGDIHFESAMKSADHWDDWEFFRDLLHEQFLTEKDGHPDWMRPAVSIMVIKYGLKWPGDFSEPIHFAGDRCDVELEVPLDELDHSGSESPDDLIYGTWGPI